MDMIVTRYKLILFYALTFVVSWPAWFAMSRLYHGDEPNPFVYLFSTLGGLGPLISLAILERVSNGRIRIRQVLSQIRIRDAKFRWFLLAIFALPAITLAGSLGYWLLGKEPAFRLIPPGPDGLGLLVLPVMAIHFSVALVTSPLFEEPGWRGFALTPLQARFGRELGSLIVGLLWWTWHQPMNLAFGIEPTIYSVISMVALSFMIDSLFNLSGRNLFTAMLAHQSSGTVMIFLYEGTDNLLRLGLLIGFVLLLRVRERRIATQTFQERRMPITARLGTR